MHAWIVMRCKSDIQDNVTQSRDEVSDNIMNTIIKGYNWSKENITWSRDNTDNHEYDDER